LKENGYSVTSLFCGAGGLDLGFKWQGFEIVWANDNNSNAVKTYNYNIGKHALRQDILSIAPDEIPRADIVIGGPPCQPYSHLGLRRKNDPRGTLVFRFLDIVREMRPKVLVMENVPGIESSRIDGHRLVDYLVERFETIGYTVNKMRLIATDYLVPQLRRRVVLVGALGLIPEKPDPSAFAKVCYEINYKDFDLSACAAIGDLGECVGKGELATYKCPPHSEFAKLMRYKQNEKVTLHECPRMSETDKALVRHIPPGGNYRDIPDYVAPGRVKKYKKTGGRTTAYGRLHPDRPSYTINTYFRRPNVGSNFHYEQDRLITPREAMRFQSFPDDFEVLFNSQDERNAMIGNAVPPLMARAVAWSVQMSLEGRPMPGRQTTLQGFHR
jgi:DNA (cytosine-5)-methyltransferase 1